jgi:hypothetical protein
MLLLNNKNKMTTSSIPMATIVSWILCLRSSAILLFSYGSSLASVLLQKPGAVFLQSLITGFYVITDVFSFTRR